MTKTQLAAELTRISKMQIADITRAVKHGEKAIALNEVRDMAQRLNRLAEALSPRPVPAAAIAHEAERPQGA